mgnify:CR=1 FL=1
MRSRSVVAMGNFGDVVIESTNNGRNIATKCIAFHRSAQICFKATHGFDWVVQANFYELNQTLFEFAVAKVCSVFGVGVPILTPYGFDLLCFRDHVEFSMELCQPLSEPVDSSIVTRLKHCMRVMHLLRIVHKDIKPANILYCGSVGDYVLCDFGISHVVTVR